MQNILESSLFSITVNMEREMPRRSFTAAEHKSGDVDFDGVASMCERAALQGTRRSRLKCSQRRHG